MSVILGLMCVYVLVKKTPTIRREMGEKPQETGIAYYILCIIGNANKNKDLQRVGARGPLGGVYIFICNLDIFFNF